MPHFSTSEVGDASLKGEVDGDQQAEEHVQCYQLNHSVTVSNLIWTAMLILAVAAGLEPASCICEITEADKNIFLGLEPTVVKKQECAQSQALLKGMNLGVQLQV